MHVNKPVTDAGRQLADGEEYIVSRTILNGRATCLFHHI